HIYTITDAVAGEIQFKTKPTAPKITYTHTDPTKVTEADIIGAYVRKHRQTHGHGIGNRRL
ncbi:hypothetical protein, partial [Kingella kingae]|uniref:hypothetical protein n=1 Tax=Kingella kingae TaxID=504 RepID=UPI001E37062D